MSGNSNVTNLSNNAARSSSPRQPATRRNSELQDLTVVNYTGGRPGRWGSTHISVRMVAVRPADDQRRHGDRLDSVFGSTNIDGHGAETWQTAFSS